jgi:hypothetical protein
VNFQEDSKASKTLTLINRLKCKNHTLNPNGYLDMLKTAPQVKKGIWLLFTIVLNQCIIVSMSLADQRSGISKQIQRRRRFCSNLFRPTVSLHSIVSEYISL